MSAYPLKQALKLSTVNPYEKYKKTKAETKTHRAATYKYQIREHPQNMRLGNMLDDLCDVHNHFLKLEKPVLIASTANMRGVIVCNRT